MVIKSTNFRHTPCIGQQIHTFSFASSESYFVI